MKRNWMIVVLCTMVVAFGSFDQLFAKEEDEGAVELKEVIVTATRDWEEERKVPYNVSVITEEDIARWMLHCGRLSVNKNLQAPQRRLEVVCSAANTQA